MCRIPSSTSHHYKTVGSWIAKLAQQVLTHAIAHEGLLAEVQAPLYYIVPNRRVRQFVGREDILHNIDKALSPGSGPLIAVFMKNYEKKREKILKNTPPLSQYMKRLGYNEKETSLNVSTTWELSFEQLESQASEKDIEVKLLTLFAFFDNMDISEELFAEFKANEETHPKSAELLIWLNAFANGATG